MEGNEGRNFMFTPDLLMYTHHTCTRGSGAEEGGKNERGRKEKTGGLKGVGERRGRKDGRWGGEGEGR